MESITEYQTSPVVEVFKTNVHSAQDAFDLVSSLKKTFPGFNINIDMEDCDRILRVESFGKFIDISRIEVVVKAKGHSIEQLN
jgi:hypothetical protein